MSHKVKVTAYCSGIAKCDRKVKMHTYNIGYIDKEKTSDLTDEDTNKCIESTKAWANNNNRFKTVVGLKVKFYEVELKDDKYGTLESYFPLSETNKEIVIQ